MNDWLPTLSHGHDATCNVFLRKGQSLRRSSKANRCLDVRVMIEAMSTFGHVERGPLPSADPYWSCRWRGSHGGVQVLDAGLQPPSDLSLVPN